MRKPFLASDTGRGCGSPGFQGEPTSAPMQRVSSMPSLSSDPWMSLRPRRGIGGRSAGPAPLPEYPLRRHSQSVPHLHDDPRKPPGLSSLT